ncbi:hypothetical protein BC936DRAFT_147696 [Jimgerdemannia flammicorona]|uniref:Uncharacterized protein n=1 Tax=Jimgerdemannia flammicorona TaxID=994334 RepID=A0A433D4N9_9FUNG|nr:hypothetical protein BC936DRAFT_147696 [Jimgerdemannia flammicorona]
MINYKETVEANQVVSGPSSGSVPMIFAKNQKDKKTILNRRLFEYTGPLIVLYHEVFGQFLTNSTNQNMTISADHYKKTEAFLIAASEFYQGEPQYREVAVSQLLKLIGDHMDQLQYGDGCVLSSRVDDTITYQMIWKLKNELNLDSSKPVIQACLYYYGYWSQNDICY